MKFRFVAVVISSVCMVLVSTGCSTMADAKAGKGTGTSQTFAVASVSDVSKCETNRGT